MGFDDFVPGEMQIHAVVDSRKLQIPPRPVRLQKRQLNAAIVFYLTGAVVIHCVRGEHSHRQKAIVGIVPLDSDLACPVVCRRIEVQRQAAAAVVLPKADVQHWRGGKNAVSVRLLRAPKAPEILAGRFGKKEEAAVHEPLPRFQCAVLILIRHGS